MLWSMPYQQVSTAYGMVKSTCAWLKQQCNPIVMEIPISFPVGGPGDYLVPLYQYMQQLQPEDNTVHKLKVVIIDHIVSIPAIKLSVMEMTHRYASTHSRNSIIPSFCCRNQSVHSCNHLLRIVRKSQLTGTMNTKLRLALPFSSAFMRRRICTW
jgi:hypothetical protein